MFDKITSRISKLCYGLNGDFVEPVTSLTSLHLYHLYLPSLPLLPPQVEVTQKVISGVYNGVTTVELDTLAAETAASMTTKHPDYATLAARIAVSNLHKETKKTFSGEPANTLTASPTVVPSPSSSLYLQL